MAKSTWKTYVTDYSKISEGHMIVENASWKRLRNILDITR